MRNLEAEPTGGGAQLSAGDGVVGGEHSWTLGQQAGDGTHTKAEVYSPVSRILGHKPRLPVIIPLAEHLQGPLPRLSPGIQGWQEPQATSWSFDQNCCVLVGTPEVAGTHAYKCTHTHTHMCRPHSWKHWLPVRTESLPLPCLGGRGGGRDHLPLPKSSCKQPLAGGLPQRKFSGSALGGEAPLRGASLPTGSSTRGLGHLPSSQSQPRTGPRSLLSPRVAHGDTELMSWVTLIRVAVTNCLISEIPFS